jgi:hypothetical protein
MTCGVEVGLNSHEVAASQEIGTRMVIDAQMDSGAFFSQNSGGPRNVTEMQAAVQIRHQRHPIRTEDGFTYLQTSEDARPSTFKPHHRSGKGR